MGLLSKLVVGLGLDAGEYNKGLDAAKGKAQTSAQAIGSKLRGIGDAMTGVGKKLTVGLTLPLAAMGVGALNAASDLEESMNKVKVVFGDSAGAILEWSTTAATAMGQSRQEALEAAGTFGNLFTAMGMGQGEAAEMSTSLVELASDLASFNNIDPSIALEKLRAGLVGEIEPLRTLGVNLTAATVAAKAMEMGLVAEGEELTAAAKAQASYALIVEQTTTAQGDFARTSEGLANQTRIAKAQLADAAAVMGAQLLPIGLKVVTWINDLLARFQALTPEQQKVIAIMAGLAAAVGPVLMVLGTLISSIGTIIGVLGSVGGALGTVAGILTGPVGLAIAAVVAAVLAFKLAWDTNFLGIRDTLTEIWNNFLLPAFENIWEWLQTTIPLALETLRGFWEDVLLPAMQAVWNFIETYLIPLFQALVEVGIAVVKKELEILTGLWENVLLPILEKVWQFIDENILPIFVDIANTVAHTLGPKLEWLKTNILDPLAEAFSRISGVISSIIGFLTDLANKIMNLELPDWLTPGSPTPFEYALRGINEELQKMARARLPALRMELEATGSVQGRAPTNQFNLTVQSRAPEDVVYRFNVMRALMGA